MVTINWGLVASRNVPGEEPSEPYDLSGFSIGFTYTWPTAPVITLPDYNVTANDGADFATAVQTGGRRVIVPAGTYSTALTTWANDVDVVMDNGATLTAGVTMTTVARIRWTGGNIVNTAGAGISISNNSADVLFDNVNMDFEPAGAGNEGISMSSNVDRFAMINSTLDLQTGNGWGLHTLAVDASWRYNDIILANCRINCPAGATYRFNPINRLIVVDTINNYEQIGRTDFFTGQRISGGDFIHWENVVNVGYQHLDFSNTEPQPFPYDVSDMTVVNNQVHFQGGTMAGIHIIGSGGATWSNSQHYSRTNTAPYTPSLSGATDGGGNVGFPNWDNATIDFSAMPGKTSISDYGADH